MYRSVVLSRFYGETEEGIRTDRSTFVHEIFLDHRKLPKWNRHNSVKVCAQVSHPHLKQLDHNVHNSNI